MPSGLRTSVPLKITSSIFSLRRVLVLCSPRTQRMASTTLLLPLPFGPTMAVTPLGNSMRASANDLNPNISSDLRYMNVSFCRDLIGEHQWECHGSVLYHRLHMEIKENTACSGS